MFIVLPQVFGQQRQGREVHGRHVDWIKRGYEDGVFLLTGSLQPAWAAGSWPTTLRVRSWRAWVEADPFVAENVVAAEILEIDPSKARAATRFPDRLILRYSDALEPGAERRP